MWIVSARKQQKETKLEMGRSKGTFEKETLYTSKNETRYAEKKKTNGLV